MNVTGKHHIVHLFHLTKLLFLSLFVGPKLRISKGKTLMKKPIFKADGLDTQYQSIFSDVSSIIDAA